MERVAPQSVGRGPLLELLPAGSTLYRLSGILTLTLTFGAACRGHALNSFSRVYQQ